MRTKIPVLQEPFTGHFDDHHRFLLNQMLCRVDAVDAYTGADHYARRLSTSAKKRNHVRELTALGYRVTIEPAS